LDLVGRGSYDPEGGGGRPEVYVAGGGAWVPRHAVALGLASAGGLRDKDAGALRGSTPYLERLDLAWARHVTEKGWEKLSGTWTGGGPAHLGLRGASGLTPKALSKLLGGKGLASLKSLDLAMCPALDDDALSALKGTPMLASLSLAGCAWLTDVGVQAALAAAPGLRRLDLRGCPGLSPLVPLLVARGAPALMKLDLRGCRGVGGAAAAAKGLAPLAATLRCLLLDPGPSSSTAPPGWGADLDASDDGSEEPEGGTDDESWDPDLDEDGGTAAMRDAADAEVAEPVLGEPPLFLAGRAWETGRQGELPGLAPGAPLSVHGPSLDALWATSHLRGRPTAEQRAVWDASGGAPPLWESAPEASDAGLAGVAALTRLTRLVIRRETVPLEGLAPLEHLTQLRRLDLAGCVGVGGEELAQLKDLDGVRRLCLAVPPGSGPGSAGVLRHLGELEGLRRLDLRGWAGAGGGFGELAELLPSGLTCLRLQGWDPAPPEERARQQQDMRVTLGRLSRLARLEVCAPGDGPTDAHAAALTALTALTRLDLEGWTSESFVGKSLASLSALPRLVRLSVAGSIHVGAAGLTRLLRSGLGGRLERLNIAGCAGIGASSEADVEALLNALSDNVASLEALDVRATGLSGPRVLRALAKAAKRGLGEEGEAGDDAAALLAAADQADEAVWPGLASFAADPRPPAWTADLAQAGSPAVDVGGPDGDDDGGPHWPLAVRRCPDVVAPRFMVDSPARLALAGALRAVRRLDLSGCRLDRAALDFCSELHGLRDVSLRGARLGEPDALLPLSKLFRLARLDLAGSDAADKHLHAIAALSGCLEELDVSGCSGITVKGLIGKAGLKRLKRLRHLACGGAGRTADEIAADPSGHPGEEFVERVRLAVPSRCVVDHVLF